MIGTRVIAYVASHPLIKPTEDPGFIDFVYPDGAMRIVFDDGRSITGYPDGRIPSWGANAYWVEEAS